MRRRSAESRRIALGLLALVTGAVGEALLFRAGLRKLGFAFLIAAMGLAMAAWGRASLTDPLLSAVGRRRRPTGFMPRGGTAIRLAAIVGALLFTVASLAAWFADPGATFGLQGALWLASIALLIGACVRWRIGGAGETKAGPPWTRLESAAFLGVVALALFTFLADLNNIPWRFHYDEAIAYQEGLRFYRGPHISVFTTTWFDTGLPSMWFALSGSLMHLVGTDLGGVRFSVALAGALTVLPLYGLGRLLIGRAGAFFAAFGWATTPVVIHYSRVSIINMTTAFFWAACFCFLLKGLRSRSRLDLALAGLLAGLSMYTYYGARLLPLLLLVFCAYLALYHRQEFRERAAELALVPVGFLVGFGPLLAYFLHNPSRWAGRGVDLLVPADSSTLASLVRLNFLGLSVVSSNDHVYWDALLPPAEAVLLLLGLGVLLWRWREPAAFLTLSWALGVLVVGGTLIDAGHIPAFNHWTPAFPAFFLAMALPPALLLQSLRRAGANWWRFGWGVVVAGMLALAGVNAHTYLVTYPRAVPPAFEAAQGRFLATLPGTERVRFVGNSWIPFLPTIGEMMASHVRAGDLLNPSRSLPTVPDRRDLIFVFNDDEVQYLPLVASYYPGGARGQMSTPGGPIGLTYRVSAAQALAGHGVWLTLTGQSGRRFWEGRVDAIGVLPKHVRPRLPLTATWSGFFLAKAEEISFTTAGADAVQLSVQGAAALPGRPIKLDQGWVAFAARARLTQLARVRLLLTSAAGHTSELDRGSLWPRRAVGGLAVTLEGPANITHRIDPFVAASILGARGTHASNALFLKRDPDFVPIASREQDVVRVRWLGELYATGGTYRMELRTDAHARLYIGSHLVLDLCDNEAPRNSFYNPGGYVVVPGGYPVRTALVTLPRGWHRVRLYLEATGINSGLEWAWTRPDGVREIVPPRVLRHNDRQGAEGSRTSSIRC